MSISTITVDHVATLSSGITPLVSKFTTALGPMIITPPKSGNLRMVASIAGTLEMDGDLLRMDFTTIAVIMVRSG